MVKAVQAAKIMVFTGKRKTAIARATVVIPGKGRIYVNSVPLEIYPIELARMKMYEPILVAGKDLINNMDIHVNVRGGGVMGQAEAVRVTIARALAAVGGEEVRRKLLEYDRRMLICDPRRTEPKKYGGYSARRKKQKSWDWI